jgi:hypothetical protein
VWVLLRLVGGEGLSMSLQIGRRVRRVRKGKEKAGGKTTHHPKIGPLLPLPTGDNDSSLLDPPSTAGEIPSEAENAVVAIESLLPPLLLFPSCSLKEERKSEVWCAADP